MTQESRLDGLDPRSADGVVDAARSLAAGRAGDALARLERALCVHPDHPEVLRLHAGILSLRGDHPQARAAAARAVAQRPADALYLNTQGSVLFAAGDLDGAVTAFRHATELDPRLAIAWYNLGVVLTRSVSMDDAAAAVRRALALAPDDAGAQLLRADALRSEGRAPEAEAAYRRVLARQPWRGTAWWGLATLHGDALGSADAKRMRDAMHDPRGSSEDRIATAFALASAFDAHGHYAESFAILEQAHLAARRQRRWDAQAFSARAASIAAAFGQTPRGSIDSDLGHEVIFIVGMPRSGTTLVEQILASHSQVSGTGELQDLPLVLAEESRRVGCSFPAWVGAARDADWRRLGERYLERTARWRRRRPFFTDKLPNNWAYIDAIRAMLPGARIIVCRRDPLETCFACYRQYLFGNDYAHTPDDLAAFYRVFRSSVQRSLALYPDTVHRHDYEALLADPGTDIRRLLAFCNLPFEPGCLRFHETRRAVHSPSASQVRQPLKASTTRAQRYGILLDPLRSALGLPPFAG